MSYKNIMFPVLLIFLVAFIASGVFAIEKKPVEIKKAQIQKPGISNNQVLYLDDLGVDLMVSRVEISRVMYRDAPHIRVKPYIKNMCNGIVRDQIKVLYDGLSYAVWIRDGIGSKQEKGASAYYIPDNSARNLRIPDFHVEVDNNNLIPENLNTNNRCGPINFSSTENSKTHRCPMTNYRCIKKPPIKKYQMKDPIVR